MGMDRIAQTQGATQGGSQANDGKVYWNSYAEKIVHEQVTANLNTLMERAVISFCQGVNGKDGDGFARSGMPAALNAGEFRKAAMIFIAPRYYVEHGEEVPGVKQLRQVEQAMFLEGLEQMEERARQAAEAAQPVPTAPARPAKPANPTGSPYGTTDDDIRIWPAFVMLGAIAAIGIGAALLHAFW